MSPIFSAMLYIIKVLHKLSKLLLALYNILLTNASGQVEFYTPELNNIDNYTVFAFTP